MWNHVGDDQVDVWTRGGGGKRRGRGYRYRIPFKSIHVAMATDLSIYLIWILSVGQSERRILACTCWSDARSDARAE